MSPTEYEKNWITKIQDDILRTFPEDFLIEIDVNNIDLPGKPLIKGSELFGTYEITDLEGNAYLSSSNIYEIKYILYANKSLPKQIKVPVNGDDFEIIVKQYEKHLDEIVKMINAELSKSIDTPNEQLNILNKIFRALNLQRY